MQNKNTKPYHVKYLTHPGDAEMIRAAIEDYLEQEYAKGYEFEFMTVPGGGEIDFCFYIVTKRMEKR